MSQLLRSLEDRIAREPNEDLRAELRARLAMNLARVGRFLEAKNAIAKVRVAYGGGRSGRVTALTMLAEALVLHYESLSPNALDRAVRSQLLGQAMGDKEIISLASAWRAFLEFEASKFADAAISMQRALEAATPNDHEPQTRCAVVASIAFALCGDTVSSQHWFAVGREHALKEGDQASIDALLHNKAAFGVAWLRARSCLSNVEPQLVAHARMDLNSSRNLQHLTQISAHAGYVHLAEARLRMLEGDWSGALGLLDTVSSAGPFPKGHFNQSQLDLERSICVARVESTERALELFGNVTESEIASLDIDERLVCTWMRWQLTVLDAKFGDQVKAKKEFEVESGKYESHVSELRDLFKSFKSGGAQQLSKAM